MGNKAGTIMSVCPGGLCSEDSLVELREENAVLLEKIFSLEADRKSLQILVDNEVEKRRSKEKVHREQLLETEELKTIVDDDSQTIARLKGDLSEERKAVMRERTARQKWQEKAEKLESYTKDTVRSYEKDKRGRELELLVLKQKNRELVERLGELEAYHRLHATSNHVAAQPVLTSPVVQDDIKKSIALSASLLATALPRKLPSQAASSVTTVTTELSP